MKKHDCIVSIGHRCGRSLRACDRAHVIIAATLKEDQETRLISWHVSKIQTFAPSPELTQPGDHAPRLTSTHFSLHQAFGLARSLY